MVAKARGARSQRRDDDGAAGICLPPITAYGLSSEAIEAVERAPPPKPRRQPLHASASEPSLASEWVSDSALAADVGLGLAQMKQQMEREARRQRQKAFHMGRAADQLVAAERRWDRGT